METTQQTNKEDLRKAFIGNKLTDCYIQKYRNTEEIKKAQREHKPRILNNLIRYEELLNRRIERLKNNVLLPEEEFILNLEIEERLTRINRLHIY